MLNAAEVRQLRHQWAEWKRFGYELVVHFAILCSTYSRARDRSPKSRVRSAAALGGLHPRSAAAVEANVLAAVAAQLALWVVTELYGSASIKNPGRSYLWAFLAALRILEGLLPHTAWLNMCMCGARHRSGCLARAPTMGALWHAPFPVGASFGAPYATRPCAADA